MTIEPIVIELRGRPVSKKNMYTPNKNGRGFHINKELKEALDRLSMQVPAQYRDIKLQHPDIDFSFTFIHETWDRDGAVTTLMDILVEYGVLFNDNLKRCNGRITIHPAVRGEYDSSTIVLLPKTVFELSAPRYAPLRRQKRTAPLLGLHPPEVGLDRFAELAEGSWE